MGEQTRIAIYKMDGEMLVDRLVPLSLSNELLAVEIRSLRTGIYHLETEKDGQKILEHFFIDNN